MSINMSYSTNVMNESVIYKKIICTVDIHRKTMELVFIRRHAYYTLLNNRLIIIIFPESYL